MKALRIGFIGAGSIVPIHMRALESLGRADLVAICSRSREHAQATARGTDMSVYTDPEVMLRQEQLDAAFVAVPPYAAPGVCRLLTARDIPFLVEKPVAALDPALACQVADEVERRGLVAAVGYQLRGLDFLEQVRDEMRVRPPELVLARWLGWTPNSEWWAKPELSGGQVIEQMTHLYDLATILLGGATVVAASSIGASTSALLRFQSGAVGTFVNTHHAKQTSIALELASIGTIWLDTDQSAWVLTLAGYPVIKTSRSPHEVQAEAFLNAIADRDPTRVLATYRSGLNTYLLTRSVYDYAGRGKD